MNFRFLGFWLRFVFIYHFNWEKMDKMIKLNEAEEDYKNTKMGAIVFGILLILLIIGYELFIANV